MWIKKGYHNHLLGTIDQLGKSEENLRRKLEQKTEDHIRLNRDYIALQNQFRAKKK